MFFNYVLENLNTIFKYNKIFKYEIIENFHVVPYCLYNSIDLSVSEVGNTTIECEFVRLTFSALCLQYVRLVWAQPPHRHWPIGTE